MSSEQLIAVATDALRGLVQAALPSGTAVIVGLPSPEGQELSGLSVHLFHVGVPPVVRAGPPIRVDGRRERPALRLQLDYLVSGLGGEALQELGLLGTALQALLDSPLGGRDSIAALLSQPDRLAAMAAGSLTVQWRVLELPLDQVSAVWLASGMRQRGGVFVRAEAVWQAESA